MKVVCINNELLLPNRGKTRLTINKVYDVKEKSYIGFTVINDDGEEETFVSERFEMLRGKNLEDLGI